MTILRMIELLEIEHECMLRKSHDSCDSKCGECDLVQDDGELHEMYTDVIGLLKLREPKPPIIKENSYGWKFYYCPSCEKEFYQNNKFSFCDKCGQAVKWDDR